MELLVALRLVEIESIETGRINWVYLTERLSMT